MANFSQKFYFEPLRSLAFGSISGSYAAVGTPLTDTARKVKFQNLTDANITVSTDGVNDMDIIPLNGFALYDVVDSPNMNEQKPQIAVGTQFYIKGSPSTGSFYVTITGAN